MKRCVHALGLLLLAEVIAGLKRAGLTVVLAESGVTHARELLDDVFVIDRGVVARSPA